MFQNVLKFRKIFIRIGEFWTRVGKIKQTFENKTAKMRKCLTKFSRIVECGAAQSLLALLEQRALCTFFSLTPQASLHCCGLMASSPKPCASSGGRMPEALFMVFLSDSKSAVDGCFQFQNFQAFPVFRLP